MSRTRWRDGLRLVGFLALGVLGSAPRAEAEWLVGGSRTNAILEFTDSGQFVRDFIAPGSGGLSRPGGVAFGPDGNLYVSSNTTNQILRYNGATGAFMDVFGSGGGLTKPSELVFGPDRNLYVNSQGTNSVLRFNGATGAFMGVFATDGGINQNSTGLTFGPDGNLYVNSHKDNDVLRFDGKTGALLGTFVPNLAGGLVQPSALAFGPDGNFYVAAHDPSAGHGVVLRYNGTTGAFIDTFVTQDSGGLSNPTALVFAPDGDLYVDSRGGNKVLRYNAMTGAFISTFIPSGTAGLNGANSLVHFAAAPEPSSLVLLILGALGVVAARVFARRDPASTRAQGRAVGCAGVSSTIGVVPSSKLSPGRLSR